MNTQQEKVLLLLKNAGSRGVNSWDLTYLHAVKQAPTRVKELKEKGNKIFSRTEKNKSVTYILLQGPKIPARGLKIKDEYVWVYEGFTAKQVLKSEVNRQEALL